jgi:hypothetical protein
MDNFMLIASFSTKIAIQLSYVALKFMSSRVMTEAAAPGSGQGTENSPPACECIAVFQGKFA